MPVNKKPTIENENKDTVTVTVDTSVDNTITELEQLKQENKNLQDTVNTLMAQMKEFMDSQKVTVSKENTTNTQTSTSSSDILEYEEPNANKQIRIMSMFYGHLVLRNTQNTAAAKLLTFSKFGEIKSVLYHDLVDYVNTERKFAEQGYFYILDKAAVYYLGLSTEYNRLVDFNFINNVMNYSESELYDIVNTMTDVQRETLVSRLTDRMFNGEQLDMNKLEVIRKTTGLDVVERVEQRKEFQANAQKQG